MSNALVAFLVILKLVDLFGVSIVKPLQWRRWLFNPVLILHINLGHEKLDTKQLLFDLVSLLRIRYKRGLGILSIPLFYKFIVFLILGLWVTLLLYYFLPEEIEEVEKEFQDKIFTVYGLDNFKLDNVVSALGGKISVTNTTNGKVTADALTKEYLEAELELEKIKDGGDIGNLATALGGKISAIKTVDGKVTTKVLTTSDLKTELKKIRNETYLSRGEYEMALESLFGKEAKERYILRFLDQGDKSSKFELHRAVNFCDNLHFNNLSDKSLKNSNKFTVRFKAESSLSQRLYCDVDKILKHLYRALWQGYPVYKEASEQGRNKYLKPWSDEDYKEKTEDKKKVEAKEEIKFHRDNWFIFASQIFSSHILKLDHPKSHDGIDLHKSQPRPYHLISYLVGIFLVYILYRFFFAVGPGRVIRRLDYIDKRIVASSDNLEIGSGLLMSGLAMRRKKEYHPLDSRQCEFLLLDVLETNHRFSSFTPHPEFVFIFDELDKISPENEDANTGKNSESINMNLGDSVRLRKFEVEQLLSNLKNIITVAPCRFIFIAGRDMMDANLADQGEVNHLYSSLFDETLYIPSFLTDHSDEDEEDISSMVEQYVCRRLLPKPIAYYLYQKNRGDDVGDSSISPILDDEYNCWSLKIYFEYLKQLKGKDEEDWAELISFLLDFIYFLTYRSAGSPKKLSMQFEQFVRPVPEDMLIRGKKEYFNHPPIVNNSIFLLQFNEREQYQVQLISHIFIMLHGETSHMVRQYGDKLSLSMFSILDYLFKYHSIAFSTRDLERMPDVLDIHRAPALPQVIDVILSKMLTPYLQQLNNGVYEYRFLQHFQREVMYISQFSERDLAAFNFTLDESITIKQHYHDLLRRQMQFQKGYYEGIQGEIKESDTHTLPSLHIILGDIYSLDREFSEALTEYRNALQYLEPALNVFNVPHDGKVTQYEGSSSLLDVPPREDGGSSNNASSHPIYPISTSMNHLILYVQILLKMGLIAERRSQYDSASSHYFQAYRAVDHVLKSRLGERYIIPNFSLLSILVQPYICLTYIHVKRDLLPNSAEQFISRAYCKLEKQIFELNNNSDNYPKIEPNDAQQIVFLMKVKINWAEVLLQQSLFEKAGHIYIEIIEKLIMVVLRKGRGDVSDMDIIKESLNILGRDDINNINVFNMLGGALSGLGDVCCALSLEKSNTESDYGEAFDIPDNNEWQQKLKNLADQSTPFSLQPTCLKKGIYIYLLSSEIYKQANMFSEAALSLWKIQYILSYGLSFEVLLSTDTKLEGGFFTDSQWIFDTSYELKKFADEAFDASYKTHSMRLTGIGVNSSDISNWIAPPLVQTSMVLTHYWESERDQTILSDEQFQLRHMGAFPVHARILASYLKARSYYLHAEDFPLILTEQAKEEKQKYISKAFFLLVQSAEDSSAYEGGVDSLNPHLGVIYFLLWKLLQKINEHYEDTETFKSKNKIKKEYSGEKGRFLEQDYCRTRADKLLGEIIGRHTRSYAFTNYINRQYYLYGAFSDSYVQCLWAVDYSICPLVKKMKEELAANS